VNHIVTEALAVTAAIVGGIATFYAVFAWPTFFDSNYMLGWGWIGWLPGLWLAHRVGGRLREWVRGAFREEDGRG
jgi:hypothetical protein